MWKNHRPSSLVLALAIWWPVCGHCSVCLSWLRSGESSWDCGAWSGNGRRMPRKIKSKTHRKRTLVPAHLETIARGVSWWVWESRRRRRREVGAMGLSSRPGPAASIGVPGSPHERGVPRSAVPVREAENKAQQHPQHPQQHRLTRTAAQAARGMAECGFNATIRVRSSKHRHGGSGRNERARTTLPRSVSR